MQGWKGRGNSAEITLVLRTWKDKKIATLFWFLILIGDIRSGKAARLQPQDITLLNQLQNHQNCQCKGHGYMKATYMICLLEIKAQDEVLDIFFPSVLSLFIKGCRLSIKSWPLGHLYAKKIQH